MSEHTGRYVCTRCAYVYDPKMGDAFHQIPPGVPFQELPEGWTCPLCYAGKEEFDSLD